MHTRVLYLDGLRGILALVVFLHHYILMFYPELIFGGNYEGYLKSGHFSPYKIIAHTPVNLFFNPGMAIHFFFLLSGYVQTRNYFMKPELAFLQKSAIKRYFRLALPILAVVLLVFIFHKLHFITKENIPLSILNSGWVKSLLPDSLSFFQVIMEGLCNCFMVNSRYYQVLWTMPTELINSFIILCLLMILHHLKHKTTVFVAILVIQFFVLGEYYSMAFVLGMLFANLELNSRNFNRVFSMPLVKLICFFIGLYFASYPFTSYQNAAANSLYAPISFFDTYPHVISYLIGVTLLFCVLLHSKTSQKLL